MFNIGSGFYEYLISNLFRSSEPVRNHIVEYKVSLNERNSPSFLNMKIIFSKKKNVVIAIVVFLVVFIPTLVAGVFYYQNVNTTLTKQAFDQRATIASLAASAIRVKLGQLTGIVQGYATQPGVIADVAAGNWDGAKSIIIDQENDPRNYDNYIGRFLLLDTKGNVKVAFPGIASEGIGQPDDAISEIQGPILEQGADSFVSDVFQRSVYPKNNHIEILVPIRKNSVLVGVAEITVPINALSDFGTDVDITTDGFVYVVDRLGHIISHPKYASDGPIIDYSSIPVVQKVMQGGSGAGIAYNPIEHQERVFAYESVPEYGWGVISVEPVNEVFATRDSILSEIILFIILISFIELIVVGGVLFLASRP